MTVSPDTPAVREDNCDDLDPVDKICWTYLANTNWRGREDLRTQAETLIEIPSPESDRETIETFCKIAIVTMTAVAGLVWIAVHAVTW